MSVDAMPVFRPDLSLCFRDPVLRIRSSVFFLSECPLLRRLLMFFALGGSVTLAMGIATLLTPWGRSYAWTEFWTTAIALSLVFGVPTLMLIALKPAHSFRLEVFPFDGMACRKRYWFGIRVSSKWTQIGVVTDRFVVCEVDAEFREDVGPTGSSKSVLESVLYLMGPLGLFIGFFIPKPSTTILRQPMFLLYTPVGLAAGHPPIACFFTQQDAATILEKIDCGLLRESYNQNLWMNF